MDKNDFHRLRICVVAFFPQFPVQASDLARHFKREGAIVIQSSFQKNIWLRALDIALTLIQRRQDYDIILIQSHSYLHFLYTSLSVILGNILRKRVLVMYIGGGAVDFFPRFRRFVSFFFRRADAIVVNSGFVLKAFENIGLCAVIIPAVMDLESWEFRLRERLKPNLIWVRHLSPEYNPQMAIRALKIVKEKYPGANLQFVGGDHTQMREELEALIEEQQIAGITFLGFVPPGQLSAILDDNDIFINTTTVDNQPRSVLEAQAMGLPVVSTNVGGTPDIIEDGFTGLLVESDNAHMLAEKVMLLLKDQALATEIALKGRQAAQQHSWENIREKWLAILQTISTDRENK